MCIILNLNEGNGRGRCEKNKCICNEMYTGEDCSELDCKYNISDSCRNPNNNKVKILIKGMFRSWKLCLS